MTVQGIDYRLVAYYDQAEYFHLELEETGLTPLRTEEETTKPSKLVDPPLQAMEENRRDRLVLVQSKPLMTVAGVAVKEKDGQIVSGDTGAWFKHGDNFLYVLLCDGIGSSSLAEQGSVPAVRLLEQSLQTGAWPENALRILNPALALRSDEAAGGFTTTDLLRVDLFTGEAGVCKYGATPTYVKKGYFVRRVTDMVLPVDLTTGKGGFSGVTRLQLEAGDYALLVADGVAGSASNQRARDRLAVFDSDNSRELAQALIDDSGTQVDAADDRTALVLELVRRNR